MIDSVVENRVGVTVFDLDTLSLPFAVTYLSGGPVVGRYETLQEIDEPIARCDVNVLDFIRED